LFNQVREEKKEQLHRAVARIKDKFGERAIQRAR
jgi:hypothetical protein